MSVTLTPELLDELRKLESNATGGPYGCVLADKAIAALPALLDAAAELELLKELMRGDCKYCKHKCEQMSLRYRACQGMGAGKLRDMRSCALPPDKPRMQELHTF